MKLVFDGPFSSINAEVWSKLCASCGLTPKNVDGLELDVASVRAIKKNVSITTIGRADFTIPDGPGAGAETQTVQGGESGGQ